MRYSCITALASTRQSRYSLRPFNPVWTTPKPGSESPRSMASSSSVATDLLEPHIQRITRRSGCRRSRGGCAACAGTQGEAVLEGMIASPDAEESVAAITNAEPSLHEAIERRIRDTDPGVRAAALKRLAEDFCRTSDRFAMKFDKQLADRDQRVRSAAVYLLANIEGEEALEDTRDGSNRPIQRSSVCSRVGARLTTVTTQR